jgi:hypothetical protein
MSPNGSPLSADPAAVTSRGEAPAEGWRVLAPVVGVALAFAVTGLIFSAVTTGMHPKQAPRLARPAPAATARPVTEGFGGSDGRLQRRDTGPGWRSARGVWAVRGGEARVLRPAPEGPSLALRAVGPVRAVEVRAAAMAPGLGLAFRCQGADNCWRLEAVPRFGTWNVVKVVGGAERVVTNLGTVPAASGTTVRVEMDGGRLRFAVDGQMVKTIADRDLIDASRAGLSLRGPRGSRDARWDDFRAIGQGRRGS